ncbi:alpha/beta fold hydrolase [Flavobacterium sp.]|uniref:alpha/beta hydrolase family protein n=1 Tax=Flavobacterium sp. TaxID=239 RepID=UPI002612D5BD|nr:alpha/beta fold hydrolase [Flavobacterium sp.]
MKKQILFFLLFFTAAAFAQDVTGNWYGLVKFPGGQLRLTLHVNKAQDSYTATLDSPDQGAEGIPVSKIAFTDNTLTFTIPAIKAEYKGTYADNIITGTFTQNNFPMPLNLGREEVKTEAPKRPQEPVKPYPYHSEDVTFTNAKQGIILSGTLTLPQQKGNFPAVVLISGSGPQDRNEELLGHKPFLVIADYLTRNGIAVLRYDDRGTGASGGKFAGATTEDFAADAAAALAYLQSRPEINKKKTGLIGHSEGGIIAPIVANTNKDTGFIVLLAGTAIPGDELMLLQNYLINKAAGMPEAELTKLGGINRKIYDAIKQETDINVLKAKLDEIFNKELKPLFISKGIPESQVAQYIDMQVAELTSAWYINFIRYNPAPALEKVQCPILAINGSNDLQVAPVANLEAIKRAAAKSGNKDVTVKELPGLNHLFQQSTTGLPAEYGEIEQTIAPAALNEILQWIKKRV